MRQFTFNQNLQSKYNFRNKIMLILKMQESTDCKSSLTKKIITTEMSGKFASTSVYSTVLKLWELIQSFTRLSCCSSSAGSCVSSTKYQILSVKQVALSFNAIASKMRSLYHFLEKPRYLLHNVADCLGKKSTKQK